MTDFEALRDALVDRYALERELAAGGMATAYPTRDGSSTCRRFGVPIPDCLNVVLRWFDEPRAKVPR
jgi:hypothetical protein